MKVIKWFVILAIFLAVLAVVAQNVQVLSYGVSFRLDVPHYGSWRTKDFPLGLLFIAAAVAGAFFTGLAALGDNYRLRSRLRESQRKAATLEMQVARDRRDPGPTED